MKLYVMRHGTAEDHAESGQDFDRALTAQGREQVRHVGKALVDAGEEPLMIFTSPLVRAVQTAEIVAIVTRLSDRAGTVETRRELAAGNDPWELVRDLVRSSCKRAMLVGHEPDVSDLVGRLMGEPLPRAFGKGMVVGLSLPSDKSGEAKSLGHGAPATLRFALDAKTLAFDPDRR
jgi:phosphohistidine phosphatase